MSEQNALRGLVRAATTALNQERGLDSVNQKALHLVGGGTVVYGAYRCWKFFGRFLKR
jgi:hypothetical protein